MKRPLLAALLLAAPLLSRPATAHMVWLEREGPTVQLFFGEYAEGLRERAGGHLDAIKNPRLVGATAPLTRQPDHLAFGPLPAGDARAVEELAPWEDRRRGGRTRSVFVAREGRTDTRPALDLELVPTRAGGDEFTLMFREAPLPRTKVTFIGPHGWTKELTTDAEGRVTLPTPWAGRYVAEIQHTDTTPAGANTPAYDRTSYVATLSFLTETGIPWTAQR